MLQKLNCSFYWQILMTQYYFKKGIFNPLSIHQRLMINQTLTQLRLHFITASHFD